MSKANGRVVDQVRINVYAIVHRARLIPNHQSESVLRLFDMSKDMRPSPNRDPDWTQHAFKKEERDTQPLRVKEGNKSLPAGREAEVADPGFFRRRRIEPSSVPAKHGSHPSPRNGSRHLNIYIEK
jgi:hypothetical protein